jgi:hypothetical protein
MEFTDLCFYGYQYNVIFGENSKTKLVNMDYRICRLCSIVNILWNKEFRTRVDITRTYCIRISISIRNDNEALWIGPRGRVLRLCDTGKRNSVAFSPQGNYTDWATATGRRILMPTFTDRGLSRGQRGGTLMTVNLGPEPLIFFQVALHLCSRG